MPGILGHAVDAYFEVQMGGGPLHPGAVDSRNDIARSHLGALRDEVALQVHVARDDARGALVGAAVAHAQINAPDAEAAVGLAADLAW